MSGPFKLNLRIYQGATYSRVFTWKIGTLLASVPVDLTGCTARMQLREEVDSDAVLLELTTTNNRIALGGAAGTVTFALTAADTAALAFTRAVYDLEVVLADGSVRRLMAGHVIVSPEVTR